jgi:hypothetical protein
MKRYWSGLVAGYWLGVRVDIESEGRAVLEKRQRLGFTLVEGAALVVVDNEVLQFREIVLGWSEGEGWWFWCYSAPWAVAKTVLGSVGLALLSVLTFRFLRLSLL